MNLALTKKAIIVLTFIVILFGVVLLLKAKQRGAMNSEITYACQEEGGDGRYTGRIFFRQVHCDQADCVESYYDEKREMISNKPPTMRCNKSISKEDFLSKNKTYAEFIDLEETHYKKYFSFLKKFGRCITDDQRTVYRVSQGFLDTVSSSFYDSSGVFLGNLQSGMVGETQKKLPFQVISCQEITGDFFKLRTGVTLKE